MSQPAALALLPQRREFRSRSAPVERRQTGRE